MDKLLRRAIRSRIDELKILRDAICGLCRLAIAFSGARLLAWVFPIIAGQIVTLFGGVARAALIMCSVYVIGLIVPWFMPEPAGEPLPE